MPTREAESTLSAAPVTVRIFGSLRPVCEELGLPHVFETSVPDEGICARDLAQTLGIDLRLIEGVFVNHTVHGLAVRVSPGDRIAFVPYDTPGPHRVFLGLYSAGRDESA